MDAKTILAGLAWRMQSPDNNDNAVFQKCINESYSVAHGVRTRNSTAGKVPYASLLQDKYLSLFHPTVANGSTDKDVNNLKRLYAKKDPASRRPGRISGRKGRENTANKGPTQGHHTDTNGHQVRASSKTQTSYGRETTKGHATHDHFESEGTQSRGANASTSSKGSYSAGSKSKKKSSCAGSASTSRGVKRKGGGKRANTSNSKTHDGATAGASTGNMYTRLPDEPGWAHMQRLTELTNKGDKDAAKLLEDMLSGNSE